MGWESEIPMTMASAQLASPRPLARLTGLFQLLEAIAGACGQVVVLGQLVVAGNAAATAANIAA